MIETADTWAINTSVSGAETIQNGQTVTAYADYSGAAKFPIEAHYGASGYQHDDYTNDVRNPYMGLLFVVTGEEIP